MWLIIEAKWRKLLLFPLRVYPLEFMGEVLTVHEPALPVESTCLEEEMAWWMCLLKQQELAFWLQYKEKEQPNVSCLPCRNRLTLIQKTEFGQVLPPKDTTM